MSSKADIRRVGVRLVPGDASDPEVVARIVALGAEAEAAGIDLVAVPERLGAGGVPAALPVCSAIAAVTSRIAIATALLPLPLHHPLRVAEDAATVDGIAGGRLELGVGLGADRTELAGFGLEAGERVDRFEEAIAILRAAWADGPVVHEGEHFTVDGLEVFPKPVRPGGPPLWVGARSEAALDRAARLALGVLVEPGTEFSLYLEGCARSGATARVAVTGPADAVADHAREARAAHPSLALEAWLDTDPMAPNPLSAAKALVDSGA